MPILDLFIRFFYRSFNIVLYFLKILRQFIHKFVKLSYRKNIRSISNKYRKISIINVVYAC